MTGKFRIVFLMSLASGSLITMAWQVKMLSPSLPFQEILFFRSLVHLVFILPFLVNERLVKTRTEISLLLRRAVYGALGVGAFFYSLNFLDPSTATVLSWASPLFTFQFARLEGGEPRNFSATIALGVIATGLAALVLQAHGSLTLFATGIGLLGAMFSGLGYLSLGKSARHFSPSLIAASFSAVLLLASTPGTWRHFVPPATSLWPSLVLLGLCALVYQQCVALAYRKAKASVVAPLALLTPILSLLFELVFKGKTLWSAECFAVLAMAGGLLWLESPTLTLFTSKTPAAPKPTDDSAAPWTIDKRWPTNKISFISSLPTSYSTRSKNADGGRPANICN